METRNLNEVTIIKKTDGSFDMLQGRVSVAVTGVAALTTTTLEKEDILLLQTATKEEINRILGRYLNV